MSKEYVESTRTLIAIARTAEKVAHRLGILYDRKTAVTLSVLAALGLEELDKMDKEIDRMIEKGGVFKPDTGSENPEAKPDVT